MKNDNESPFLCKVKLNPKVPLTPKQQEALDKLGPILNKNNWEHSNADPNEEVVFGYSEPKTFASRD